MKILISISLLFLFAKINYVHATNSTTEIKKAIKLKLYERPQWKKFMHYSFGVFGNRSEVDDKSYFLHKDGKTNLKKELMATIEKTYLTYKYLEDKNIVCKFPARVKWLSKFITFPDLKLIFKRCNKYKKFIKDNFPESVSLVFSSYYLESPASAFGHTLLRLSKKKKIKQDRYTELLDSGVSYGAQVTTENPLLYTIFGMIGGFKGTFSLIPYFYKVREYNDFESRDLWSYSLNLNKKQKVKFMDHLWELGNSWFSYYFFDENCSYQILGLLEAVNPKWNLIEKVPFYVIPIDTIKAVSKVPGLVGNLSFRPSIKRVFDNTYSQLNLKEKDLFSKLINLNDVTKISNFNLSKKSKSNIIDVAIDFLDFK